MKLEIEVTQEDIDKGVRSNPYKCPYSNAVKRLFSKAFQVYTHSHYDPQSGVWWSCAVSSWGGHISFELKGDLASKARRFDETGEMQPFKFEVEI